MSAPSVKRQKLDAASNALRKPFRSPLKHPASETLSLQSSHAFRGSEATAAQRTKNESSKRPLNAEGFFVSKERNRTQRTLPPYLERDLNSDVQVASLLRSQRELVRELNDLNEELNTCEAADKIEVNGEKFKIEGELDGELLALICKWKRLSRRAAEELFGPVKDKVNRSGGAKAWRARQAEQRKFLEDYNEDPTPEPKSEEEEMDEGTERDFFAEYSIDSESGAEKEARGDQEVIEGSEDEFSMETMLNMLQIKLDIIGYDREAQRWKE